MLAELPLHIVQDLNSNFNMALEWLVERHDPKIICHPAVVIFADLLWTRLAQLLGVLVLGAAFCIRSC